MFRFRRASDPRRVLIFRAIFFRLRLVPLLRDKRIKSSAAGGAPGSAGRIGRSERSHCAGRLYAIHIGRRTIRLNPSNPHTRIEAYRKVRIRAS